MVLLPKRATCEVFKGRSQVPRSSFTVNVTELPDEERQTAASSGRRDVNACFSTNGLGREPLGFPRASAERDGDGDGVRKRWRVGGEPLVLDRPEL